MRAEQRATQLHARGVDARLYGHDALSQPGTGGLHAFFLLGDEPELYNLPRQPVVPTKGVRKSWIAAAAGAAGLIALALLGGRK